jgi:hypothetical protein
MDPFSGRPEWEPKRVVLAEIESGDAGGGEARAPRPDYRFLRPVLYPRLAGRWCAIPLFSTHRQQLPCSASCVPSGPYSPPRPPFAARAFERVGEVSRQFRGCTCLLI